MTLTLAINLFVGVLLVIALVRRPQALPLTLAISFGLAIAAADIAPGHHIRPALMALDAMTVIAAWFLCGEHRSTRASLVAWLGLCKILFGIAGGFSPSYVIWAAGNNALFVVMILVAGGLTDGIIAWLGRGVAGFRARRARLLRYLVPHQ